MASGYDHDRPADGQAPLGDLLAGKPAQREYQGDGELAPTAAMPAATVERLRLASNGVREAERLIRRALDHDCPSAVADAIAATKAALDHLVSIR